MDTTKKPASETKICYDPQLIESILKKMDTDPEIAPKGLAQIDFYYNLANSLRYNGKMMDITVEQNDQALSDSQEGDEPVAPSPNPVEGDEVTVWSSDEEFN